MVEAPVNELVHHAGVHHQAGRFQDAEALYRQALERQPDHAAALHGLGGIAFQVGRLDAAEDLIRRAIAADPNEANYQGAYGVLLTAQRRWPDAISAFRRAIELKPSQYQWHLHLADLLRAQGQMESAGTVYTGVIDLLPKVPEAYFHVATALMQLGRLDDAIRCARKAVEIRPDYPDALNTLGLAYLQSGRTDEAISALRHVVRLVPGKVEPLNNLASVLGVTGRTEEVIPILREVLEIDPNNATARHNLGNALKDYGDMEGALAEYDKAAQADPNYAATDSNRLYAMHFHPDYDAARLLEEHLHWAKRKADPLKAAIQPHENNRDPDRRLRIGYVSPDFRHHVVGWNIRPLLESHDRERFEVYCYSGVLSQDDLTEELKQHAQVWRQIVGMNDEHLARQIQEDRIDILVDLALHTEGNRLLTFARKPAPVQVTYLGYCSTTGLDTIDYRFSDPHLDPRDEDLRFYVEKTVRLPQSYWCYRPAGPTPEPMPLPAAKAGVITFGCLNNFAKVSSETLKLWGEILKAFPKSRLLVNGPAETPAYEVFQRFAVAGIPIHRLRFVNRRKYDQYMETYDRIDIALDPTPFGGGITTCDALWMGVPVVTLRGRTAVGRGGASILANIGLPELIADTPEDYVRIAVSLCQHPARLVELRSTLRQRMQSSPLMDAERFTRAVETAYREMWHRWCDFTANPR